MKYEVWFLYNGRGRQAIEHVVRCPLPEGIVPEDLLRGFWIDDAGVANLGSATYGWGSATYGGRTMWVPPGRITSVLPLSEDTSVIRSAPSEASELSPAKARVTIKWRPHWLASHEFIPQNPNFRPRDVTCHECGLLADDPVHAPCA